MRLPCSTCGHRYGEHIDGDRGPCATEIDRCSCAHFTLGDTTAGDEREALDAEQVEALAAALCAIGGLTPGWATTHIEERTYWRNQAGQLVRAGWRRDGEEARAAVERVTKLHRPYRIFTECGCKEHLEPVTYTEEFAACERGYLYTICHHCCTGDSDYQDEDCADRHGHDKETPICSTVAALTTSPAAGHETGDQA